MTEPAPVRAYVYGGDWVADCGRDGCSNVEHLFTPARMNGPRILQRPFYACSYCGFQADISWPDTGFMAEIGEILGKRPIPDTRNWYPQDHATAIRFRIPHGQSAADLRAENEAHGVPA
jgi:hypothetical protein